MPVVGYTKTLLDKMPMKHTKVEKTGKIIFEKMVICLITRTYTADWPTERLKIP